MHLVVTLSVFITLTVGHPRPRIERENTEFNKVSLEIQCLTLSLVNSFSKGWSAFLEDETSSFFDISLTWSLNNTVPAWIKGSYVSSCMVTLLAISLIIDRLRMVQPGNISVMTVTIPHGWIAGGSFTSLHSMENP